MPTGVVSYKAEVLGYLQQHTFEVGELMAAPKRKETIESCILLSA
jgi:hypothetical protein